MRRRRSMALGALVAAWAMLGVTAHARAGDVDYDGVDDSLDVCNNTPLGAAVDITGRPLGDIDADCDTDLSDFALFQQGFTGPLALPMDMVLISAGEFAMGDHFGVGDADELPVHSVYVDSFHIGMHEVTNQQYSAYLNSGFLRGVLKVVDGTVYDATDEDDSHPYCDTHSAVADSRIQWNGSTFGVVSNKHDHPMVQVSWYGAAAFCNWLSVQHSRQPCYDETTWQCDFYSDGFRLPTEAEWEFACRGGLCAPELYYMFPWCSNDIDGSSANYDGSGDPFDGFPPETTPVGYYNGGQSPTGSDMANGYGLYDVSGNVWEWCNDWWGATYYNSSPHDNPQGPATGVYRVLRGGSWENSTVHLRCAGRAPGLRPWVRGKKDGFRVVSRN